MVEKIKVKQATDIAQQADIAVALTYALYNIKIAIPKLKADCSLRQGAGHLKGTYKG